MITLFMGAKIFGGSTYLYLPLSYKLDMNMNNILIKIWKNIERPYTL
jgi:hypothetical protein